MVIPVVTWKSVCWTLVFSIESSTDICDQGHLLHIFDKLCLGDEHLQPGIVRMLGQSSLASDYCLFLSGSQLQLGPT